MPVFTDSPDTVRFTIYRAKAVGSGGFGPPEAIANLKYDNPKDAKPLCMRPGGFTE